MIDSRICHTYITHCVVQATATLKSHFLGIAHSTQNQNRPIIEWGRHIRKYYWQAFLISLHFFLLSFLPSQLLRDQLMIPPVMKHILPIENSVFVVLKQNHLVFIVCRKGTSSQSYLPSQFLYEGNNLSSETFP